MVTGTGIHLKFRGNTQAAPNPPMSLYRYEVGDDRGVSGEVRTDLYLSMPDKAHPPSLWPSLITFRQATLELDIEADRGAAGDDSIPHRPPHLRRVVRVMWNGD